MSRIRYTGYRSPEVWADLGLIGERLSFTDDEIVTKLGIGFIKNQSVECAMDTAVRFTLLNAGENGEISAKQMLNQHTRLAALFEAGIVADGWYKNEDNHTIRDWVYIKSLQQLHWNTPSSSYSYNNTHFTGHLLGKKVCLHGRAIWPVDSLYRAHKSREDDSYNEGDKGFVTYRYKENIRALSNALDDKTVIHYINKSLNRMKQSRKAVQTSSGRGRTFRWNAWGWLDEYRQKHLVTMAKQRKLGDVVNGWEFTKGEITNMYGVEICDHEWQPVESLYTYGVQMNVPVWAKYAWDRTYTTIALPHMFFTLEEAEELVNELNNNGYPRKGASIRHNGEPLFPTFSVKKIQQRMSVRGEVMIEEYNPPLEILKRLQLGSKEIYTEMSAMLKHKPAKIAGHRTTKEE